MTTAIVIDKISHTFPAKGKTSERKALHAVSLAINEGCIFGLLGPNGGGKSTLFRILSTALNPTEGSARIFNYDVVRDASTVRSILGVVFQHPALDKKLTVRENLIHHGHLYGLSGAALSEKIATVLKQLSLSDRSEDFVETLSGGLARRVEIAKGLLNNPRLLIMDEPSTGLDPSARREMWESLLELKKSGVTILLTTHLMEEGEKCDDIAILHQGRVVAQGTPDTLKKKIGGDIVSIQTSQPTTLVSLLHSKWNLKALSFNGVVRIEMPEGHKFIPQLIEACPGQVSSVQLGKPTLEDVFVHETGQFFSPEEKIS